MRVLPTKPESTGGVGRRKGVVISALIGTAIDCVHYPTPFRMSKREICSAIGNEPPRPFANLLGLHCQTSFEMDTKFFNSPFETIHLSRSDKNELEDPNEWKLVKVHDQMRVYSSRERKRRSRYPFQSDRADGDLQSILCVGSIPSTLDEVLHTVLGWSSEEMNAKPSYMADFSSAAILSSIKEPTLGNPFEALTVKWAELDVRRRSMGLVKNRDYVYVEATGIKYLATGERLGYHVMHSVEISGAGELPGRVRAMLSTCLFFHEVNDRSVSVYAMAMLAPMSDRVRRVVVPRFTNTLLSVVKSAEDAKMKNLAHSFGKSCSEVSNLKSSISNQTCATCTKRAWRLGKFSRRHATCLVCSRYVCSACKIDKKVKVQTAGQHKATRKVSFCFSCLTDAMTAHESEFSFASDASGSTRPAYRSVWASKIPRWGLVDSDERSGGSIDFSSTR